MTKFVPVDRDTLYLFPPSVAKIVPYIAAGRASHHAPLWARFSEPTPLPPHADTVERMQHRLKTREGKAVYARAANRRLSR